VAEGYTGGVKRHCRSKKNDRDGSRLNTGNTLRVHDMQAVNSGKIGMTTNQITAVSAYAHVSREISARALGRLGVYKERRVAY